MVVMQDIFSGSIFAESASPSRAGKTPCRPPVFQATGAIDLLQMFFLTLGQLVQAMTELSAPC